MTHPDMSTGTGRCADCGGDLLEGTCATCAFGWMRESQAGTEGVEISGGRYQLLECLARGGMGVVYAAKDTELGRVVALKVLRGAAFAGPGEVARFTLETKAAASLDHPHIVPVYEIGLEEGEPFFTMRLIDGESLAERLRKRGSLALREAASLLAPMARAVEHAHSHGVLHRDLKPGNILIDSTGKPWLTDFGLAKLSSGDSGLTRSTDALGTPHYMSPEMADGRAHEFTVASDVWALGVMLWEMVTGHPPFTGQSPMEVLQSIVRDGLPPPPALLRQPCDLLTIAGRCMEKRPADRLATAGIVAEELERWMRGEPIHSRPSTMLEKARKWTRRRPLHAALAAAATVFVGVASLLWFRAERANGTLEITVEKLAVTNDRLAESLQRATATRLAGEALLQVEGNPDRALLLAAAAAEKLVGGTALPEARSALMEVMQRVGGTACMPTDTEADTPNDSLLPPDYYGHAGKISPDGRWLLTFPATEFYLGGRSLTAALFDLRNPFRTAPVRRWKVPNSGTRSAFAPLACWLRDSAGFVLIDGNAHVHSVNALTGLPAVTRDDNTTLDAAPPIRELGGLTPPTGLEAARIHHLEMVTATNPTGPEKVRIAVCWRDGARYALQTWQADPDGLRSTGVALIPGLVEEDAMVRASPDGRWLAFGARTWMPLAGDGTFALVYDFSNPALSPIRLLTDPATAMAQSKDSRDLLASSMLKAEFGTGKAGVDFVIIPHPGHRLHIHDLRGRSPGDAVPGLPLPPHRSRLWAFALAPDGRAVMESRQADGVTVHRLTPSGDGSAPRPEGGPPIHFPMTEEGSALAFSPDNEWMFASRKNEVLAWRRHGLSDAQSPLKLRGSPATIGAIASSPDSRTLFTVGGGWVLRRWSFDGVNTALNPREIAVPAAAVRVTALSPDGNWIAAACEGNHTLDAGDPSADGWAAVGRIGALYLTPLAAHGAAATGIAFSREGKYLAAAGGMKVRAWNFPEVAAAIDNQSPVPSVMFAFSSETMLPQYDACVTWFPGEKLFCVHGGGGDLQWDFTKPDPLAGTLGAPVSSILYQLPAVALSPDGKFTAIARHGWDAGKPRPGNPQQGNQVLLFDGGYETNNRFLHALPANFEDRCHLAISPDGRWMAAGGKGKPATLWDLNAPDIAASRREAPVISSLSTGVAFSPDNRQLAIGTGSGGGAGTLNLWEFSNPDTAASVLTIRTPRAIHTITWHSDGRLITAGTGGTVSVWEMDLPKLVGMARRAAGRELTPAERQLHGL